MTATAHRLDSFRASRALVHPLWLGSLLLLVANDHLLKGAGLLPGALTGKLSDLAGMLVAPAVLASLLLVRSRRGWLAAHLAIGAGFAAINVSPLAARAFEQVMSHTPFPWAIVVDPTDLVALPLLWLSFHVLGAVATRPIWRGSQRWLQGTALTAGAVACMGTSPPCEGEECGGGPPPPTPCDIDGDCDGGVIPRENASLTFGNDTSTQRLVRVRPLLSTLVVDCETLLADPTGNLSREMFAPAEAWLLEPGRALPLQNDGCDAYLVDAQGLGMTLLAWSSSTYPTRVTSTDTREITDRMIVMRAENGALTVGEHPAVFEPPPAEVEAAPAECAVPDETVGVDWSTAIYGTYPIAGIESSPDGCHLLDLSYEQIVLCLPLIELPFAVGEEIDISPLNAIGAYPETDEATVADGLRIRGLETTLHITRGNIVARASESGLFNPDRDFEVSATVPEGCAALQHDACGNAVAPLGLTVLGPGVDGIAELEAGEAVTLSEAGDTLYLVRAEHRPIRNTECATAASTTTYFESVLVHRHAGE